MVSATTIGLTRDLDTDATGERASSFPVPQVFKSFFNNKRSNSDSRSPSFASRDEIMPKLDVCSNPRAGETTAAPTSYNRRTMTSSSSSSSSFSLSSMQTSKSNDIANFCQGVPQKVNEAHKGNLELFISLQEDALFLPEIKKSRRHCHRHRASRQRRDEEIDEVASDDENEERPHLTVRANGEAGQPRERASDESADKPPTEEQLKRMRRNVEEEYVPAPVADQSLGIHTGGAKETKRESLAPCSTLRGSVLLKVRKPTKIKEVGVSFTCCSRTSWNILPPTAILVDSTIPNTTQLEDIAYLGVHHWDFVPLEQFAPAQQSYNRINPDQSATLVGQDLYGADYAVIADKAGEVLHRKYTRVYNDNACRLRGSASHKIPVFDLRRSRPRKLKVNNVSSEGVVFPPGDYIYNFTLLVDAGVPPSISVPNGEVKYQLNAKVVRAGRFLTNLTGKLDVDVVRAPQDMTGYSGSGGSSDSIVMSRVWDDSLVYILHVDRKNIPLDDPTRISLSLVPLNHKNVLVRRIQIFATEHVSYLYSLDSSIKYSDPVKKVLLLEKEAPQGEDLLHGRDSMVFESSLVLPSSSPKSSKSFLPLIPFRARPSDDSADYFEPDARGPYIKVKHRLRVVVTVSVPCPTQNKRNLFDLDFTTQIHVLSRHCTPANTLLPCYPKPLETEEEFTGEPPSFEDAMEHKVLGASRASLASIDGKAVFTADMDTV